MFHKAQTHFFFALSLVWVLSSCVQPHSLSSDVSSLSPANPSSNSSSSGVSSSDSASEDSHSSEDSSSPSATLQNPLQVMALEMSGQYGDCTLFKNGDYEILIDGGTTDSATQVTQLMKDYVTDHVLDLLILSHPHSDHYGGFTEGITSPSMGGSFVDAGITAISTIVDNGFDSYSSYFQGVWGNGIRSYWVKKGSVYKDIYSIVSGHTYDATWILNQDLSISWLDTGYYPTPSGLVSRDGNSTSIACSIHYGKYDFVMVGDLPSTPENGLASKYQAHPFIPSGDTVVFKAAHHGSPGANDSSFLGLIKPRYGWASAAIAGASQSSSGPSAQHPYKAARSRIEAFTGVDHFFWNGTSGTLQMNIPIDLSSFSIHGEGRRYGDYYANGVLVDPFSETDTPLEKTKWALAGF